MRRLILILAAAVPLAAATTTVSQTVIGPDGQPGTGVAYIRITAPCSYGGSYVGERTITVKFAPSGSPAVTTFSVALVPNVGTDGSFGGTGACAGTSYTVSWAFAGGQNQPPETWLVPVSATPVSIDAVKTGPVPLPAVQINPSQISTEGGTVGNNMCLTVSGWAAGVCVPVASVFGRTGAVTAASGDYTASQVGLGNVTNDAQLKSSQLVTAVGSPGSDANVPSEKAVRSAIPSVPVASVFGRTGAVVATNGDYTTAQVTESGNLYFTNARALSAMSGLYENPLTFSLPLSRSTNTISLPVATSGQNGYLASGDWSMFNGKQAALTNYSVISGLTGYPSTFPPTNSGNWAGTWQTYSPGYFQPALTNYSTISGLTGYPSTFPPTTTGLCLLTGCTFTGTAGGSGWSVTAAGAATLLSVNKTTFTAPTTAWTITPAGDNQSTTIPGGTLINSGQIGTVAAQALVTSVGSPGTNSNVPSEEAVRTALSNVGPDIFDGSTTSLADGSTISWTCGSGSGAQCTATWTPPAGVNWVTVQEWGAGGGGSGSTAGTASGSAGGGGGYWQGPCPVTPGSGVTVAVGVGGLASTYNSGAGFGGSSSFGTCATVTGGDGGANVNGPFGGRLSTADKVAWFAYSGFVGAGNANCGSNTGAGSGTGGNGVRFDVGGCGGFIQTSSGSTGAPGGNAPNGGGGGGSGGYNNATGGTGGVSGLGNTIYTNGGNGGKGGGWTSGGGQVACSAGVAPGGGGGSAGAQTAGLSNATGCNGARGEVRIYFGH